jgi:chorismate synthase
VGLRATPICEAMLAIVLMDHYLRHRGQNADVRCPTPIITGPIITGPVITGQDMDKGS